MVTPPTRTGSRVSNFTNSLSTTRFPFQTSASLRSTSGGSKVSAATGGAAGSEGANEDDAGLSPEQLAERAFWESIDLSEVSAKENSGIEDVFFHITQRLVERKVAIEREKALRERDSIMLTHATPPPPGIDDAARRWSCCAS